MCVADSINECTAVRITILEPCTLSASELLQLDSSRSQGGPRASPRWTGATSRYLMPREIQFFFFLYSAAPLVSPLAKACAPCALTQSRGKRAPNIWQPINHSFFFLSSQTRITSGLKRWRGDVLSRRQSVHCSIQELPCTAREQGGEFYLSLLGLQVQLSGTISVGCETTKCLSLAVNDFEAQAVPLLS